MVTSTHIIKHWHGRALLGVTLLAIGLAVGILVLTLPPVGNESAADVTTYEQNMQRSNAASTARLNGMAVRYAMKDASTVRFNAMARYYAAKDAAAQPAQQRGQHRPLQRHGRPLHGEGYQHGSLQCHGPLLRSQGRRSHASAATPPAPPATTPWPSATR